MRERERGACGPSILSNESLLFNFPSFGVQKFTDKVRLSLYELDEDEDENEDDSSTSGMLPSFENNEDSAKGGVDVMRVKVRIWAGGKHHCYKTTVSRARPLPRRYFAT